MLKLLTCPRGHYWEKPVEDGVEAPSDVCPVCGDAAETMPLLDLTSPEEPPPSPSEPPPPPPLRDKEGRPIVAGYEILEDLGKGPTGIHHYKARQVLVNRTVVLKVVFAKEDPGQIAWGGLRGEAATLGRLTHPHIVRILDAGERERQLFFNAVEHIDGPSLAEALGDKPLPFRQAAALIETLARTIHQAHEKSILHRNLKPASILLPQSSFNDPKITDFGLARRPIEGDSADVELQGELPCYLSPEQAWGRTKDIGPATDVYGLGAILYELIAGRPPFGAETVTQTLDAIQSREPKPLSRWRKKVPADLDTICRKCLARSPRRRYASALELAEDLRRFANGYPIQGRQTSNAERFGKWLRRNFRGIAFVVLLLWAGLSVLLLTLSGRSGSSRTPREQAYQRDAMRRLENELLQSRRREAANSYLHLLLLAEREVDDGDPARAGELLERCPLDQRAWEWYYLRNPPSKKGNSAVFPSGLPVTSVDFSPDGQYLAIGGGDDTPQGGGIGEVAVWDLATKEQVWQEKVAAPVRGIAFSPDSSVLALVGSSEKRKDFHAVQVRASKTGRVVFARTYPGSQLTALAYSPDQTKLLVAGGDGLLRTLQAHNGVQLQQEQVKFRRVWPPGGMGAKLLPLGGANRERLALLSPDGGQIVLLRNILAPGVNEVLGHDNATLRALAYDERGDILAAAGSDQTIRLWSVNTPYRPTATLRGHHGAVTGLTFSSDYERLASCGEDGTVRIWDPKQGQNLLTLHGYTGAAGVLFQGSRVDGLALQLEDMMGKKEADRLAIMHGNKVTVLSPHP